MDGWIFRCSPRFFDILSRAAGVLADSRRSCQGRDGPEASVAGASSSTAWAFVPPMPKELTPATRRPFAGLPFR